jgi:FkbM family methyltransferase
MLYLSDRIISGSFADSLLKWIPSTLRASISYPLEAMTVKSLEQTEAWRRWRLFDEISERSNLSLFCVGLSSEHFVINCRDKHISRELFLAGEQRDFQKLLASLDIIAQKGRRPTVLIDVGANLGSICVPAVARGHFPKAIAIEPHPINCRLLRANAALNGVHDKIAIFEMAAGAQPQELLELELSTDNWGDHRIAVAAEATAESHASRERIQVQSKRLDDVLDMTDVSDALLWIDVQGYEGHVLRGAGALLASKTPICIEFWPYALQRAGSIEPLLESVAGYEVFYDLSQAGGPRPIHELRPFFDEIGYGEQQTDILIV